MRPALAPVEAGPAEAALLPGRLGQVDAPFGEEAFAAPGRDTAIVAQHQVATGHQAVGQRHAEAARQMVVAGARLLEILVDARARAIPGWPLHGGDRHAFEHLADERRGQTIIAMPALGHEAEKARPGQFRQMPAGGLCRNARPIGKLAGGQGLAAHKGREDVCPRAVAHQRANLGDSIAGNHSRHGPMVARRRRLVTMP